MGVYAGVEKTWASQTNVGRTHIATKGIVQSGLVLNLDAGVLSSYPNTSAELITNGTFDSNVNGWTTSNSTNTWSSGKMQITRSGGDGRVSYQTFTTIVGQSYRMSAEVNSSGSRGDIYIYDGSGIGGTRYLNILGTNGQTLTLTGTFTAISTITTLGFGVDSNGTSIIVDNVSVSPLWTDLSGRGNNVILTNGPTYSSANGGSIVFDGVDDFVINSSTSGIPTGNSSRTIQFWVYPKTDTNNFIQLGTGGGGNQVYIVEYYNLTGTRYLFSDGINSANNLTISGVQLPTLNTWNHITFGNSGQNWFYYVNAVSRASGTWSTTLNTIGQKVLIGKRDDYLPTPGNINGNIAQVSIYNRALSAAEIQQNFNATKSRYGL